MFSPDVWTLKPPNMLINHKHEKLTPKAEEQLKKKIQSHSFNKMISIVLPDTKTLPDNLLAIVKDTDHYIVKDLPLNELIRKVFIEGFIKRGTFYGLSADRKVDVDDCVAVTPNGVLYLSLRKEIYHSLGLEGKLSHFASKHRDRYVIQIDLKSKELNTTTKYYERVNAALSNEVLSTFNLSLVWEPPSSSTSEICPSSVAKYFSDLGCEVTLAPTKSNISQEYSLQIPRLGVDVEPTPDQIPTFYATPHELVEYVGMLALSCNFERHDFLNSWNFSGVTTEVGTAMVIRLNGLFTCQTIDKLFDSLKNLSKSQPDIPWVSMHCHGFPNSPVSFGLKEHSFTTNGDNSYVVLLTPDQHYLLYEFLSSNKALK